MKPAYTRKQLMNVRNGNFFYFRNKRYRVEDNPTVKNGAISCINTKGETVFIRTYHTVKELS